jgi:hypothetical protein
MPKKIPRNAPCPCGSGKKYEKCCYGKAFDYEEDEQRPEFSVTRSIPVIIFHGQRMARADDP